VIFRETSTFSRQRDALFSSESFRRLQLALVERPDLGAVIPGGGGLRKVRWAMEGTGKKGGARVVYYWAVRADVILLLLAYDKGRQDDMSKLQLAALRALVEHEFR
jgi:hypothetical protein